MNQHPTSQPTDDKAARPMLDEADIGSGEKNPAQRETDELIRQIPPLPASERPAAPSRNNPASLESLLPLQQ